MMDYMSIPFFIVTLLTPKVILWFNAVHDGTEKQWQNSGKIVAKTFQKICGIMFLGIVVYFNGRITVSKTVDIGSTPIVTAKV